MSIENQSYQRHIQLRGEIGKMRALSEARHIEPFMRKEIRHCLARAVACLDDINALEPELKDKE
jgi:hypothetical protein